MAIFTRGNLNASRCKTHNIMLRGSDTRSRDYCQNSMNYFAIMMLENPGFEDTGGHSNLGYKANSCDKPPVHSCWYLFSLKMRPHV